MDNPDRVAAWLLTADERGNPATAIDLERGDGQAWSAGNRVSVHVDGAAYFGRLHQLLSALEVGDWVYLTDWRIDATRQLAGPGSELGPLLAGLSRRGVAVRGLLWRSHPALVHFNQDANRVLSTLVNRAGGQLVTDQRVRRFGSHHQKLLVVHRPDDPDRCIAFVGGIDLARGRCDDPRHLGDSDPVRIDPRYGRRPPTTPSGSAGRTAPPATIATRCGPCGGGSATSPGAWSCCCATGHRHSPAPMPCRCSAPTRPGTGGSHSRPTASAASPGRT
jgi:hypothetical protein